MDWLTKALCSSIFKKQFMALTGLGFCCFLTIHLIGNLFIYGGKDMFNSYVTHLHSLEPLIKIAEAGLLIFAVIHISMALILFFQNLSARPVNYIVKKSSGGRTFASATMPYTGLLILIFTIVHLITFKFTDHESFTVFDIISSTFSKSPYLIFYIFSVVVVAVHISHGLWSAFQTIGFNHSKYNPIIQGVSIFFSIIIGFGFGFIPIFIILIS